MSEEKREHPAALEHDGAQEREDLQGWIPDLDGPQEIRDAIDRAFDYRGDITVTLKSGESVEGYIFDRQASGLTLDQCFARMIPKAGKEKISIRYSDIARLEFTGRDTAAGKRFELWLKLYHDKQAHS